MKFSKKDKDQIAERIANKYVCICSKSAPMVLRLAAKKAKEILSNAGGK